jgi:hypothetical protein
MALKIKLIELEKKIKEKILGYTFNINIFKGYKV